MTDYTRNNDAPSRRWLHTVKQLSCARCAASGSRCLLILPWMSGPVANGRCILTGHIYDERVPLKRVSIHDQSRHLASLRHSLGCQVIELQD